MSETLAADASAQSPRDGAPRARRAALALTTATALVAAFWWWSHPRVFDDHNGGAAMHSQPVARAATSMAVTLPQTGDGDTASLTLHGAEAHFAIDTAAATTSFSVCHLSKGEDPVMAIRDIGDHCRDLEPLRDGMDFRLEQWRAEEHGARGDYLVLTVTPTRPGKVKVDRVDVTYALGADHLWRRGTERLGMDVTLTAE